MQALDYSHKNEDGRVEKVPDSLITAFKTKGGRVVYDGAGVMPDIKTDRQKLSPLLIALLSKYYIFNFATNYWTGKKEVSSAKDFALTEEEYQSFLTYIKDKDYTYKTKSETELEELKKKAIEENTYDVLKPEIDALNSKINSKKKDDLTKARSVIKHYLEEEIIGRYYFQKGRIEFSLRTDEEIAKAIEMLKDESKVRTVLTTIEKPKKPFNIHKRF